MQDSSLRDNVSTSVDSVEANKTDLPRLVLLDFDGTITSKDTLLPYLYSLFMQDKSIIKALMTMLILSCGALGLINSTKLKAYLLGIYLKGLSRDEIEQRSAGFIATLLSPLQDDSRFPYAQEFFKSYSYTYNQNSSASTVEISCLNRLKQKVLRLWQPTLRPYFIDLLANVAQTDMATRSIIVSASPELYLKPIAKALNTELVCTTCEFEQDVFTGKIVCHNCKAQYKVEMLQDYLPELNDYLADTPEQSTSLITAYGNSPDDWAMLSLVQNNQDAHYNDFKQPSLVGFTVELLRLMRVQQYLKNLFVFIPLFFSGLLFNFGSLAATALCFVAFCLISSMIYVLNDIQDVDKDRHHSQKRFRPIASGRFSLKQAYAIAATLGICTLLFSLTLPVETALFILGYFVLNLGYIYYAKNLALIDLICVAVGFNFRVFAGASAIEIEPSAWLVLMVFLLAMFLVTGKRWDDLNRKNASLLRKSMYGYNKEFALSTLTFLSSINCICYILYTLDASVIERLSSNWLYITSFWVLLGNLRYLQNIFVFKQGFSPTKVLINDHALLLCLIGWIANIAVIIYV